MYCPRARLQGLVQGDVDLLHSPCGTAGIQFLPVEGLYVHRRQSREAGDPKLGDDVVAGHLLVPLVGPLPDRAPTESSSHCPK
jgi:hypothetical protein